MIPEIITNGENGLLSNNPQELKQHISDLLSNPVAAARMGERARQTILEKYPLRNFTNNWNNLFETASNKSYWTSHA